MRRLTHTKALRTQQSGAATLEFMLAFIPLFVMCLFMLEICRYMITNSILDVALSNAARQVITAPVNENTTVRIEQIIEAKKWPLLNSKNIQVSAEYFTDFKTLVTQQSSSVHHGQIYATYYLNYAYTPLLLSFSDFSFSPLNSFKRSILITHENFI